MQGATHKTSSCPSVRAGHDHLHHGTLDRGAPPAYPEERHPVGHAGTGEYRPVAQRFEAAVSPAQVLAAPLGAKPTIGGLRVQQVLQTQTVIERVPRRGPGAGRLRPQLCWHPATSSAGEGRERAGPELHGQASDLGALLDGWLAQHAEGIACVVGDPAFQERPRVRSLTPELAKGLEFDLVVIVQPDALGAVDRYVAMTRATQQLVLLARS